MNVFSEFIWQQNVQVNNLESLVLFEWKEVVLQECYGLFGATQDELILECPAIFLPDVILGDFQKLSPDIPIDT